MLRTIVLLVCLLLAALPAMAQDAAAPQITLGSSDELGEFLVGPTGLTLYLFTPDSLDTSTCYERCAELWPPLIVRNLESIALADDIPGELGLTERTTGTMQVTYNGIPLYYWYLDYAPGETKGHGVGNVWWVIPPATISIEQDDELGSILVGPTGMTVYRFDNDEMGVSNCADDCATNWPPVTVESAGDLVAGLRLPGELGTIERADGTLQVTYNGWPLYYFAEDAARGDTTGEARGDVWWTISPETVVLNEGGVLAGANGMTLYTLTDVSACDETCMEAWSPLTVGELDRLVAGEGVSGELSTVESMDGDLQVTYNGAPLFFYNDDAAPGDTMGAGDMAAPAAP